MRYESVALGFSQEEEREKGNMEGQQTFVDNVQPLGSVGSVIIIIK